MSRSPYNALMNRPLSSGKNSPLRQSAPSPADGALSAEGSGGWGLNSMLRNSMHVVTPRPPSTDPSPPAAPSSPGAAKSPMAFRARRFNHANSGSDSDLSVSLPSPSSSLPDPNRRRSGSENLPNSPNAQALHSNAMGGTLGRQLSSTSTSSSISIRPNTSPASTILAAFSGQSVHASLDGAVVAGSPGKALRPKSSETNVSNAGGSTNSTTASSSGSKVLRNRLSEDAGGHAAGAPTLSLREKLAILQRNNKALEQQLAEASNEAQQRAAQQHDAHVTAMSALQQRVAALEAQLAAQQRTATELTQRNQQLTEAQQQLQGQLATANAAAAAATAARRGNTVDAEVDGGMATPSRSTPYKALGEGGPQSPRTPLSWDTLPSGSPGSSSSSSRDSTGVAGTSDNQPLPLSPLQLLQHGGGGSGSFKGVVADDILPPHPHVWPGSPNSAPAVDGTSLRPHTAPHADYLQQRSASQSGYAAVPPSQTYDGSMPSDSASLLVVCHSEPDLAQTGAGGPSAQADGRRSTHPGALAGGAAAGCNAAAAVAAAAVAGGSDIYLAGSGPPPASPVAAAAGLSGAGVALLARQKKVIASLRQQLQQKDSAYAFLANEHAELEGQLKEVEAAKREYAARYAFMVLDQDLDGHIRVDQVGSFDMFGCYSPTVLEYAFKHWRFASGFKGYLNMDDFVKFVSLSDDRTSRDSQRFWFMVLDLDGDGAVSAEDAKWFYDSVEKDESTFVVGFEDLWHQLLDMTQPANKHRGFTSTELWKCKLGGGVIGLLLNHNNMLLHRTTAEWGRGDFPL
ncbi:hypothetical protein VaNZ11_002887 [Volvox africanus]|uniref:EF-hand domain-containing protein n=1 Tax=Volvox africanus TaxID=51714 RepID=A0ABQ5RSY5_9CHLO|nr:hypothetical protein VaNZ11_002887 [Volvox africanus]